MSAPTLLDVLAAEIAALDDAKLDTVVDTLAPLLDRIAARRQAQTPAAPANHPASGWLNAKQAAAYVGLTVPALHKHTAARTIPFEQDGPGCKLWFKSSELDAWRRGKGVTPGRRPAG
jgi:hypothetical protein